MVNTNQIRPKFQIITRKSVCQNTQSIESMYCHRKFRLLSKPRACYDDNLIERNIRWRTEGRARIGNFILGGSSNDQTSSSENQQTDTATRIRRDRTPHSALGYLTPMEFDEKTCLNSANFWV